MPPADLEPVPFVPWAEFVAGLDWRQGEHVSLCGPTGTGKTFLAQALLPRRRYVTVLGTKPKDRSLDRLRRQGYRRIRSWPPPPFTERVLLWPNMRRVGDTQAQAEAFGTALDSMFQEGGWAIYADEMRYLTRTLRLQSIMEVIWLQGRSNRVSVIGATQRPAWVPAEMFTEATHLFFWRMSDRRDLDRVGGLGGLSRDTIRHHAAQLGQHEALYLNARTGQLLRTKAE